MGLFLYLTALSEISCKQTASYCVSTVHKYNEGSQHAMQLFLIVVGFICAVELVFGSLLAVCVDCLFCNVGLCCKCCFYLVSFTIVVFCMWSIFVTSFKDISQQLLHYCERSIHKQL